MSMLLQGSWFRTGVEVNEGCSIDFRPNRDVKRGEKTLKRVQIAPASQKGTKRAIRSGNGAAIVCGVAAVEVDADDLGDAGLLHRDAVDDVGLGHGAFAVGDHNKLC